MPKWSFEQDTAGRSVVHHNAAPRFTALWTSGDDDLPGTDELIWSDPGSGDGTDSLHVFGFEWHDREPDPVSFERLMQEAAKAIDAWIASGM